MDFSPFFVVFAPANNKTDHVMHHQTVAPVRLYDEAVEAVTEIMLESPHPPALCEVEEHLHIPGGALSALFADQRDLLLAMVERAIALLHDQCVRTVVTVDGHDPVAQFQALADAYIEWAYRYPREFRIIGSMPGSQFEKNGQLMRYEKALHELMLRMLVRAQERGALDADENLPMLVAIAHTYAYGIASKMLLGDLARWAPGPDDLTTARAALYAFIRKFFKPQQSGI